jgi:hypothetical protein
MKADDVVGRILVGVVKVTGRYSPNAPAPVVDIGLANLTKKE